MQTKAAILGEVDRPWSVDDVELGDSDFGATLGLGQQVTEDVRAGKSIR